MGTHDAMLRGAPPYLGWLIVSAGGAMRLAEFHGYTAMGRLRVRIYGRRGTVAASSFVREALACDLMGAREWLVLSEPRRV